MWKSIAGKCTYRILRARFLKKGYRPYAANLLSTDLAEELVRNPDHLPLKTRLWAWKHGFLAEKVAFYGLTEENVSDYLSDFDYYRLYPLNKRFSFLIDDKLTLRYTLRKYAALLPTYFFFIDQEGAVCWLDETPDAEGRHTADHVLTVLRREGSLAFKPYSGSAGSGFHKAAYRDGTYYLSGNAIPAEDLLGFVKGLRGYICTEFVQQADVFERVYPGVAHTLRIQTAKQKDGDPACLFSFLRIGRAGQNDCVTHSTVGLTAAVDIRSGQIVRAFYVDPDGRYIDTETHPDTGASVSFRIPGWDEIVRKCLEIHRDLSVLDYLGFDVIITEGGFKICEINSFSSPRAAQRAFPFRKNDPAREYFVSKLES